MRSIINILQNDSALVALLGSANKIGMNVIGQTTLTPYVVVDQEDGNPTNSFDKDGELDFIRFTVESVAALSFTSGSVVGADEVGRAVRSALNYVTPGTYDSEVVERIQIERIGQLQEDRTANKPQVTKEDEYMLTTRP